MIPICEVCYGPIDSDDGFSFFCEADCGRSGFCSMCADPANHDCEPATDHLRHLAEFDRWESMSDRERDNEIRKAMI